MTVLLIGGGNSLKNNLTDSIEYGIMQIMKMFISRKKIQMVSVTGRFYQINWQLFCYMKNDRILFSIKKWDDEYWPSFLWRKV